MPQRIEYLSNVFIRVSTLAARFILAFALAKYLSPQSFVHYGIFVATVAYAVFLIGFDFYTFSTREIVNGDQEATGAYIKYQIVLYSVLYILLLPVFGLLALYIDWPKTLLLLFVPILILEHLNQELFRLLVAMSQQITASIVLFVRQAAWVFALILLMYSDPEARTLSHVLYFWACAGTFSILIGVRKVLSLKLGGWSHKMDWAWIVSGLKVSGILFISTLALRGIQTIDKYWLEQLASVEFLATYILFFGVAGALIALLDSGVFAFMYPELIKLVKEKNFTLAALRMRQMLLRTTILGIFFVAFSWAALPYLLSWIENDVYQSRIGMFPLILLATFINGIALVPHYGLYAHGEDHQIMLSHLAGLVMFVITVLIVREFSPEYSVLVGVNISFLTLLLWKSVNYLNLEVRCEQEY